LIYEKDSQYYNIRVVERPAFGIKKRVLLLDGSIQSAKFFGPTGNENILGEGKADYLVFPYIRLSAELIDAFKPGPSKTLAIGGGAYSIPEYIRARFPASNVTVVEIDPAVTDVAKRFFLGSTAASIRTVEADGRIFLHHAAGHYDLIYTDVYNGAFSVPFHMASRQALAAMRGALRDDGILIMNIASPLEGPASALFRSIWKTIDGLFPRTTIFGTNKDFPGERQNIILLALKSEHPALDEKLKAFEKYRYRNAIFTKDVPVLTDEYAPIDSLIKPLVLGLYPSLQEYME
jgi:spermidine synthase